MDDTHDHDRDEAPQRSVFDNGGGEYENGYDEWRRDRAEPPPQHSPGEPRPQGPPDLRNHYREAYFGDRVDAPPDRITLILTLTGVGVIFALVALLAADAWFPFVEVDNQTIYILLGLVAALMGFDHIATSLPISGPTAYHRREHPEPRTYGDREFDPDRDYRRDRYDTESDRDYDPGGHHDYRHDGGQIK